MVMGLFGLAGAIAGQPGVVADNLNDIARLATGTGNHFFELYDAVDGTVNGGWQCGRPWDSVPDQTWSATSYLRLVHEGLLGLDARVDGLHVRAAVPDGFGELAIEGYRYRQATLDLVRGLGLANTLSDDRVRRARILDRWADVLDADLARTGRSRA